jgi:hypothetical protein
MSYEINLASRQRILTASKRLPNCAELFFPFDRNADAGLIVPEVRNALFRRIRNGDGAPMECA